ncbi:hypothetical protein HMPREF1549_01016 [Actinomyces johnsonii F0510]|uniref:Uncharacterized protein n=1 Tax=Actinomyces johnsonii F0510 TaxID=1227262 RepID=U1QEV2_9ACTO|nr:hypothetical protein HMPREF1549_01016 [Actinomyces johnsonii F0510]
MGGRVGRRRHLPGRPAEVLSGFRRPGGVLSSPFPEKITLKDCYESLAKP